MMRLRKFVRRRAIALLHHKETLMLLTLFVLWIYFSHPWHFGPIPITPGWVSAAVFWDLESCHTAVTHGQSPMLCLPPEAVPIGPIAKTQQRSPDGTHHDSPFAHLDEK